MEIAWGPIRIVLLIILSVLFVAMLYRRFRQRVLASDVPQPLHAELLALEVAYHPSRLRAQVKLPVAEHIGTGLLDAQRVPMYEWPLREMTAGTHWIEHELTGRPDGTYFFELRSRTQRTERAFRLQHNA